MSDHLMQDADPGDTQTPQPETPLTEKPSALPIYMNPSFYLQQTPGEVSSSNGSAESNKHAYGEHVPPYEPPPAQRTKPPRRLPPFWRNVFQLPQKYWRVLTRPGVVTFYMEESKANWGMVWFQVILDSLLNALLPIVVIISITLETEQEMRAMNPNMLPIPLWNMIQSYLSLGLMIGGFIFLVTFIQYFFSAGIYYWIAGFFGSRGSWLEHCYCTALITVPMTALAIAVSFVPVIGRGLSLVCIIYELILRIFMTMAIHRLSNGQAVLAVVIPALLFWSGIFSIFGGWFPLF